MATKRAVTLGNIGTKAKGLGQKTSKAVRKSGKAKIFIIGFAVIGIAALLISHAATFTASVEPEDGTITGCATKTVDATASNGGAIKFCSAATATAGAHIPINYNISSLTGTVRYMSPTGSDSNPGTSTLPFATLAKAVSASAANDTIVVKGGEYRNQWSIDISKAGLHIIAAPNEIPIFNGAQTVSNTSGWTTEGSYSYRPYTPRPLSQSQGVRFDLTSDMTNLLGDGAGRYADQAWVGNTDLKQVAAKTSLAPGSFYVDPTLNATRIYLMTSDLAQPNIEISSGSPAVGRFLQIWASGVTVEGLTIKRYSPQAGDYGVITDQPAGSNFTVRNVDMSDAPFEGIHSGADNMLVQNTTMSNISWQTINTSLVDNFTLDSSIITGSDPYDQFNGSPASGVKTSRNRNATVTNSIISNNKSQGLWFDQSNINTTVANNTIIDNSNAGVFFEISDGLTFVNNYVKTSGGSQPFKAVGSGGVVLVNNTFVGGIDPVGIYTDPRSIPGCSTKTSGFCQIPSDVQSRFPIPATMDWMPRIDMMINNIIAYPTNTQYCQLQAFCITTHHPQPADAPIQTIIHHADASRGIPQTVIDGNVYVAGSSGILIRRDNNEYLSYTTLAAWTAAMAASPVSIPGVDANGKAGASWVNADGSPTSALTAAHGQAAAVPSSNAKVNAFIPAGTKHYGVLNK